MPFSVLDAVQSKVCCSLSPSEYMQSANWDPVSIVKRYLQHPKSVESGGRRDTGGKKLRDVVVAGWEPEQPPGQPWATRRLAFLLRKRRTELPISRPNESVQCRIKIMFAFAFSFLTLVTKQFPSSVGKRKDIYFHINLFSYQLQKLFSQTDFQEWWGKRFPRFQLISVSCELISAIEPKVRNSSVRSGSGERCPLHMTCKGQASIGNVAMKVCQPRVLAAGTIARPGLSS